MDNTHTLLFMGNPEHAETFRCRIYGAPAGADESGDPPGLHVVNGSTVEADEVVPRWSVYVDPADPKTALEFTSSEAAARAAAWSWRRFLDALLGDDGAVDCPAHDRLVARLKVLGWLPRDPELVRNPDGPGRIGVWRPTDAGLAALGRPIT